LHGLVLARIDRLPPERQLTLRVAAVIGRTFAFDALLYALQEHAPIDDTVLRAHLDALDILDLTPLDTVEPLTYMFRHIITREVAYQTLLFAQRRELHRAVAQWYEALGGGVAGGDALPPSPSLAPYLPLLVHHWHDAEDSGRERHYARLAGEQAAAQFANAEAVRYLSQALELTPEEELDERFALLVKREQVYDAQGARETQAHDLAAMGVLAGRLGDAGKAARVALRQARYAEATGDYPQAITAAQQAIAAAQEAGDTAAAAEGHTMWGGILRRRAEYGAARAQLSQALELLGTVAEPIGQDKALSGMGMIAWRQGEYEEAQTLLEQALLIRQQAGDRAGEASILNNLGAILQAVGEYDQAQHHHQRALGISREIGDWRGERITLNNLGEVSRVLGQYSQAQDHFQQSLAISRQIGDRYGEAILLNNLGAVLHALGENSRAVDHLQRSLDVQREVGARMVKGWALNNLGAVLLGLGDDVQAEGHYREALALRQQLGQGHYVAEDLAGLASVALARDDIAQANAYAAEMLPYLEHNPGLNGAEHPFRAVLLCYRALQAGEDPRAAEVLARARALLHERAARIADEQLRRSFLENVAEHRAILQKPSCE
jgi:tetratricopeptide (TPR) repeat protein